jgi:hypothetical protein
MSQDPEVGGCMHERSKVYEFLRVCLDCGKTEEIDEQFLGDDEEEAEMDTESIEEYWARRSDIFTHE